NLFGLVPFKKDPIIPHNHSFGITERTNPEGTVEVELDNEEINFLIEKLKLADVKSTAICFLHSDKNLQNEKKLAEILSQNNFTVVTSSDYKGNELARAEEAAKRAFCLPGLHEFKESFARIGFSTDNVSINRERSLKNFSGSLELQLLTLEDRI